MKIGIWDLEETGRYAADIEIVGFQPLEIKTLEQLDQIQGLIIIGFDDEALENRIKDSGMLSRIKERTSAGMPVFGICAGLILLAQEIIDHAYPYLGLLGVTVKRRFFGEKDDYTVELDIPALGKKPIGAIVRHAPGIIRVEPNVGILSIYQGRIVMVRQGNHLGSSFIPVKKDQNLVYQYFCSMVRDFCLAQ